MNPVTTSLVLQRELEDRITLALGEPFDFEGPSGTTMYNREKAA